MIYENLWGTIEIYHDANQMLILGRQGGTAMGCLDIKNSSLGAGGSPGNQ